MLSLATSRSKTPSAQPSDPNIRLGFGETAARRSFFFACGCTTRERRSLAVSRSGFASSSVLPKPAITGFTPALFIPGTLSNAIVCSGMACVMQRCYPSSVGPGRPLLGREGVAASRPRFRQALTVRSRCAKNAPSRGDNAKPPCLAAPSRRLCCLLRNPPSSNAVTIGLFWRVQVSFRRGGGSHQIDIQILVDM